MDPEIVKAKLESLIRCISRIEGRRPESPGALAEDLDSQDIITLNLERAVQLCVDIGSHILLDYDMPSPDSMAGVFKTLGKAGVIDTDLANRMARAAGFRNIAVHQYEAIDWDIVFSIVSYRLDDFRAFAAAIMGKLK